MSDIVERLRKRAEEEYEMLDNIHEPLLEAADTIEALRAENARLREALRPFAALYHPDENVYLDMRLEAGFNPGIVVPMKDLRAARTAMGESDE